MTEKEIEIIDDDNIDAEDYYLSDPMDPQTRKLMSNEFRRFVEERVSDLEKLKEEKGPMIFDPNDLDLGNKKSG